MTPAAEPVVRRRARGLARIEQLLAAAAIVFARDGYDRATTNAIAAEAGVSPGTLYQFFRDKAAIAAALGARYAAELDRVHALALDGLNQVDVPMAQTIDRVLDPLVAFKEANGAYVALFTRPALPEPLAGPVGRAEADFEARIVGLFLARNPDLDGAAAETAARTVFALIRGVVGQLRVDSELLVELKIAIAGYLRARDIR